MRCSRTAGTSSASAGWRARRRWASCRPTPAAAAQRRRQAPGTATADEQRLFTRLQAAYAAMLDHADQQLGGCSGSSRSGQRDDTLVLVLSDNGASQEGGPLGMVNAMGPYNFLPEPMAEKIARIDDIGGPDTHSNFPLGWAMASNTPLRATSRTPTAAASAIRW
jgi:arylsulfatase A-like enzyme